MKKMIFAVTLALLSSTAAQAAYTLVGSWRVDDGPNFGAVPPAYTGQDAAALLFGGTASMYSVSTSATMVTHTNWVSVWFAGSFPDCAAFPCGRVVAENAVTSTGGLYQNAGDTSAYVSDWAQGAQFTNYAYTGTATVPEPASWAMMIAGFGLVGAGMRRRRGLVATA